jgi:CheY-like chemotaxis protein
MSRIEPAGMPYLLVVDDDHDVREVVTQVLEDEGWLVHAASDGAFAIEHLDQNAPPGLILLDLMMPRKNGWEVLEEVSARPQLAEVPIVVLTAAADRKTRNELAARGLEVLTKPVQLSDLIAVVERKCARSYRSSPSDPGPAKAQGF